MFTEVVIALEALLNEEVEVSVEGILELLLGAEPDDHVAIFEGFASVPKSVPGLHPVKVIVDHVD